jgi:glycosyltransferase involved in cell wall biosynthesis
MKISVAMCTYNGSRYLSRQLSSIGEQTRPPYELVICDDASTDATAEMVKAFADQAPFPVKFIRNAETLGSTKNFEKAICLCGGDAIALSDQDDIWQKDKLEKLAQVVERDPEVGGVLSDALLIDENSQTLSDSLWERRRFTPRMLAALNGSRAALLLMELNPATGATFLFRSKFVKQVTPIPTEWVHDAWIAFLVATQSRLHALPERLISYRLHPAQQIGLKRVRWGGASPGDRESARAYHDILVRRWSLMTAKLATLSVDPLISRRVQERLRFLQARTALRQQKLVRRFVGATATLPGYFRYSRGLLSYCRDITCAGNRERSGTADKVKS